jgi:Winged helix DNA-binding domain
MNLERLTAWTYRRQLLGRSATGALDTLRSVIAVYSTHPTAPLALLARCGSLTPNAFKALEDRREAVRLPAMRSSGFIMPTLNAARIFAATQQRQTALARRLQYGGVDFDVYTRLTPKVLECCATPVTPSQLRACAASEHDVYLIARVLAREGKILRVGHSLRTDQLQYVSTAAWLGEELERVDASEALAWLGGEYLRAFGPARIADFAWWAGVSRGAAAAALAHARTVDRDGLLLLRDDALEVDQCEPIDPDAMDVLPKWDSYTMGYAPDGRQRFIDDRFLSLAYTSVLGSPGATSGDGLPLVLRGGRAVASWSHRFAGNRLLITITPFEEAKLPDRVFDAVGELLSASSIEVTNQDRVAPETRPAR